jgi:prephenate dehydrogenase
LTQPHFNQISIVGVGLLGGSLGMAASHMGIAGEVVGVTRSKASIEEARRAEAIDRGTTDLVEGIREADLVILCTPVSHILTVLPEVMSNVKPGAIVTDVGSTKASIVTLGEELGKSHDRSFVGSHPMAGSEKTGVRAAKASLFHDSTCFVTRTAATRSDAFVMVCRFWQTLNARLVIARPDRHDRLVASISHLPHIAAVALVRAVESFNEDKNLVKGIIGNGFRDATRIAAGDVRMWEDICSDNRGEINRARAALDKSLTEILNACKPDTCEELGDLLQDARDFREFLDHK